MQIFRRFVIAVLLTLVAALKMHATDDLQHSLDQQFQNKLVFLRGFYSDDDLTYDSEGNVTAQPRSGPWSLAMFKIEKVRLRQDGFILEGERGGSVYDLKDKRFKAYLLPGRLIRVTVLVNPATLSEPTIAKLRERLFLTRIGVSNVPDSWQDFFSNKQSAPPAKPGEILPGIESEGGPVYQVGNNVTAPRLRSKSEAEYTNAAKEARVQGTSLLLLVVNAQGIPEDIRIKNPLGLGLDEQAIHTVQEWRFDPAKLNGNPVAVSVSVEMAFHL